MHYQYLKAAAEGAARVTDHQSWCYHYTNDRSDILRDRLTKHYMIVMKGQACKLKYIPGIVCAALADFDYPTHDINLYGLSGNQRAAIANIPKSTWARNNLCDTTNFIIDDIRANAAAVRSAIDAQLLSA